MIITVFPNTLGEVQLVNYMRERKTHSESEGRWQIATSLAICPKTPPFFGHGLGFSP